MWMHTQNCSNVVRWLVVYHIYWLEFWNFMKILKFDISTIWFLSVCTVAIDSGEWFEYSRWFPSNVSWKELVSPAVTSILTAFMPNVAFSLDISPRASVASSLCEVFEIVSGEVALLIFEVFITPKGEGACGFCYMSRILSGASGNDGVFDNVIGEGALSLYQCGFIALSWMGEDSFVELLQVFSSVFAVGRGLFILCVDIFLFGCHP